MSRYLSRKFLIGIMSLILLTVLLVLGFINETSYLTGFTFVSSGYFIGNVVQKKVQQKNE